jgi:carbonic anhydrase
VSNRTTTTLVAAALFIPCLLLASCGQPDAATKKESAAPKNEAPKTGATADKPAAEAPHWDYGTERGPASWGKLDAEYAKCGDGASQSPIDFSTTATAAAPDVTMSYSPQELRIVHHEHKADLVNTGHSIQVNFPGADTLVIGGTAYTLVQFHFHSPSEHTVNGKHYPLEMHFVHKSADNKLAVVGVFVEEGQRHPVFDPVLKNLPKEKGKEVHFENVSVNVDDLLPRNRSTYRYEGSLTTPPCSEGVSWIVFTTPVEFSPEQIGAFRGVLNGNNRPTQPLNARQVGKVEMKETAAAP